MKVQNRREDTDCNSSPFKLDNRSQLTSDANANNTKSTKIATPFVRKTETTHAGVYRPLVCMLGGASPRGWTLVQSFPVRWLRVIVSPQLTGWLSGVPPRETRYRQVVLHNIVSYTWTTDRGCLMYARFDKTRTLKLTLWSNLYLLYIRVVRPRVNNSCDPLTWYYFTRASNGPTKLNIDNRFDVLKLSRTFEIDNNTIYHATIITVKLRKTHAHGRTVRYFAIMSSGLDHCAYRTSYFCTFVVVGFYFLFRCGK